MNSLLAFLDSQRANAILLTRVALAAILIVAGYNKLFNIGIPGVINGFTEMGLFAAPVLGAIVPLLEFFGGIAILLGVATRVLSIWVVVQFVIISIYVKPVLQQAGWGPTRLDITIAVLGFILAAYGAGPLALGSRVVRRRWAE